MESIEDPFDLRRVEAVAVIGDADGARTTLALSGDRNTAAGIGVAERVPDDVGKHLGDAVGIDKHGQIMPAS